MLIDGGGREDICIGDNIHMELELEFDLREYCQSGCKLHLRNSHKEDTVIEFDFIGHRITCDRERSYQDLSSVLFGRSVGNTGRISREFTADEFGALSVRIFSDTSGIEVFVNNGQQVFTWNVFPEPESTGCYLEAIGSKVGVKIKAWELLPAQC
ncbi:GH32 C-terminal domain-containing protein [Ohessyouella blattaphilus]|uniref:GH32 C-terminal domain-containing protein n=1 Tax=Ohessyouella blattaphilus TaxID=2949333 RepID=UPI003EBCC339